MSLIPLIGPQGAQRPLEALLAGVGRRQAYRETCRVRLDAAVCGRRTNAGKAACPEHVLELAYPAELVARIERRALEERQERPPATGCLAEDVLRALRFEGRATSGTLSREIGLRQRVVCRALASLRRAGRVAPAGQIRTGAVWRAT